MARDGTVRWSWVSPSAPPVLRSTPHFVRAHIFLSYTRTDAFFAASPRPLLSTELGAFPVPLSVSVRAKQKPVVHEQLHKSSHVNGEAQWR
jgi:hypothetical protein